MKYEINICKIKKIAVRYNQKIGSKIGGLTMKTTVKFLLRLMLISFLVAIFGSGLGYTENIVSA